MTTPLRPSRDSQPTIRYCGHALLRMVRARISSDDVRAIIEHPAWRRRSYGGRVEYHGYADDRRHVRVVLESDGCTVVTVVVEPFRRRTA